MTCKLCERTALYQCEGEGFCAAHREHAVEKQRARYFRLQSRFDDRDTFRTFGTTKRKFSRPPIEPDDPKRRIA